MITHAVGSPISFFNATPRGRIVNHFSADLDEVDSRMYLYGKQSFQGFLFTVAKLAVVVTGAPLVVAVGAVSAVILVLMLVRSRR